MILKFVSGKEIVLYDIDRTTKSLKIATSKTHYELVKVPWWRLFDQGKERIQDLYLNDKDDETFKNVIIVSMAQQGYTPIEG